MRAIEGERTASENEYDDYTERRRFFNQVVQPALEGMMDGSLSSLAPIFITILMTRHTLTTFLVGSGAALASGISELFSESLSDDEDLSERGKPVVHAGITALFTFLSGFLHAGCNGWSCFDGVEYHLSEPRDPANYGKRGSRLVYWYCSLQPACDDQWE
jgi:hypothetical protein